MAYRFRFDDVCINSDMKLLNTMTDYLIDIFPDCEVIWGISPLVTKSNDQRVFPKILNAHSDHRLYYKSDACGIPELRNDISLAGHGIVHVDHRLMNKESQELSIITSCSLVGADIFIPPFNKYNKDTELICDEQEIELIRFEDGWLSMEHNRFNPDHMDWYLHAREFNFEQFKTWFNG